MARKIGNADFSEIVLKADKPVIVDFYSDSCLPCKQLSPVLGDIEDTYEDKLLVVKVNVNFEEDLAAEYKVMSAPTLLLFDKGEVKDRKRGLVSKAELTEWVENIL